MQNVSRTSPGMISPSPSTSPGGISSGKITNNNTTTVNHNEPPPQVADDLFGRVSSESSEGDTLGRSPGAPSWHPHVYGKPPRSPTPHRIADILGWKTPIVSPKPIRVSPAPSLLVVPRVPLPHAMASDDSVDVCDEPLNLTTRSRDASPSPTTPPLVALGPLAPPIRPFREPLNGLNGRLAEIVAKGGIPTVPAVRVPVHTVRDPPLAKKRKKDTVTSSLPQDVTQVSQDSTTDADGERKRKKARTTFTGRQIFELEKQFEIKKYLSSSERGEMARLLGVTETQVKIWFQNRRTKWKKHDNISNAEAAEHKSHIQVPSLGTTPPPTPASSRRPPLSTSSKKQGLPCPGDSPSSADEHSNGSLLTGDGSVSESGFSEESRAMTVGPGGAGVTPPHPGSPSTASLSPVVSAQSPHASPQLEAPVMPTADTPVLGATLAAVATPVARGSREPSPAPSSKRAPISPDASAPVPS